MSAKKIFAILLLVALTGGFFYWRAHSAAATPKNSKEKIVAVELTTVRVADAPVELSAIGQITSSHSVAIRPQVSGTLLKVWFHEGDNVKAGDRLFEIDSAPYRAALAQAEAQVAKDSAALLAAEVQQERLLPLAERGYVTPQELLDAKAAAAQARASVQLARAQAATAQISLDRAGIRSPITGRTGALTVKSGNLVNAGDAMSLVTINQLQPIQAEFSLPQAQLVAVQQAMTHGQIKVLVHAQDGTVVLAEGRVIFVDNGIDATTGTVKLKAEFANKDEQLWPGTFVRFTATLRTQVNAVLVPESAVQSGANGAYVYVIDANHKAQLTNVVVDRQVGADMVISKGLKGGETIVARTPRDLTPGTTVKATDAKPTAEATDGKKKGADGIAS